MEAQTMDQPAGGRYGPSLLVACGWYVTVVAGFVVGTLSVPYTPTECSGFGSCLSPGAGLLIVGAAVGVPVGAALLAVTALVTVPVVRGVRSAILAGTLSAVVSVAVAAVAAVAYAGVR